MIFSQIWWDLLIHIVKSCLSLGICFFNYVFDCCILRPSFFLGQISISILYICHFLTVLLFSSAFCETRLSIILYIDGSLSYSINSTLYSLLSYFNCATVLDFLTIPHFIHIPFHLSCRFYILECSIPVSFCFCFRERCLLAFLWVSPLIFEVFLLILLVNHFQSFVSFFLDFWIMLLALFSCYFFKSHKNFIILVCFRILLRKALYLENL